jgi:putative ABC transport system permease protein
MLTDLLYRVRALFQWRTVEKELEDEVRFHFEHQVEKYMQSGIPRQEALRRARLEFGGIDQTKENCRDAHGTRLIEVLLQDVRFGLRMLQKSPTFTVAVLLILALGIGANTAIFSVMNALLINPYRFPEPDRIISVETHHISDRSVSVAGYRDFLDWREQNSVFEEMAIVPTGGGRNTFTEEGEPPHISSCALTTHGFLRVLGIRPVLGRFFTADEDTPGAPRVAVLSFASWHRYFGAKPDVLGHTMKFNNMLFTIIGVLPRDFSFPGANASDFFSALRENPMTDRFQHQYEVIARLKPEVSLQSAQANMTAIARRLERDYPQTNKGWGIRLSTIGDALARLAKPRVLILFLIVFIVLLLACANIAGLQLARAAARSREMAVRAALGAGRLRILGQVLTESVLLALGGGLLGLLFANWLMDVLRNVAPEESGLAASIHLDFHALVFTLGLSVLTGIFFGSAAAFYGSRTDLNSVLKGNLTFGSHTRGHGRFMSCLIVGEVALSLILLLSAGLFINDLQRALHIQIGLNTENMLTLALNPPQPKYRTPQSRILLYRDIMARLRRIPEAKDIAAIDDLPMTRSLHSHIFQVEDRAVVAIPSDKTGVHDPAINEKMVQYNAATPGLFRTLGIPLQQGRDFNAQDRDTTLPVAIINDVLKKRYFPNEDPIGVRFFDAYDRKWRTIVGVAGSYQHQKPGRPPMPTVFRPLSQTGFETPEIVLRTSRDPRQLTIIVREIVRAINPDIHILQLRTMNDVVADSLSDSLFLTRLLTGFGSFALLMSIIGIYGIVAYWVRQRVREMGIRMALGASSGNILRLALRKGTLLCIIGILLGMPAALAVSRVLSSMMSDISSHAWPVFFLVPLGLLFVSLCASYFAARRTSGVDPLTVLRSE